MTFKIYFFRWLYHGRLEDYMPAGADLATTDVEYIKFFYLEILFSIVDM